jgi:hypothetical protein
MFVHVHQIYISTKIAWSYKNKNLIMPTDCEPYEEKVTALTYKTCK